MSVSDIAHELKRRRRPYARRSWAPAAARCSAGALLGSFVMNVNYSDADEGGAVLIGSGTMAGSRP